MEEGLRGKPPGPRDPAPSSLVSDFWVLWVEVRISTGGVGVFDMRFGGFPGLNGVSRGALGIFMVISGILL